VQSADPSLRLLISFLDYLKVEKGLAPLSVAAYRSDLEQYSEFLLKRKRGLREARRQDVRDFLNALLSNGVDGRSVARKLSALRHFYKYLLLDRYIAADPTLNIDTPRQWKVLPKSLAVDEVESVLQGPPHAKDDHQAQALAGRNRAMLEVFYAGALRVSEVVNLKLEDLKLELGYVLVRGKGDKERIVPLGRAAQEVVQQYLRDARPVLAAGKSSPFCSSPAARAASRASASGRW
jgi:integrase/recombinase XerD